MFRPGKRRRSVKRILLVLSSLSLLCVFSAPVRGTIGVVREGAPAFEISKELPGDASFARQIEADLQLFSGIDSIVIDEHGTVRSDVPNRYQNGSAIYRRFLLALIADQRRVFQIEERSNSPEVHFAYADVGTVNLENGCIYYRIYVDPADFKSMGKHSRKDVASSFSVGIVLFHEISHKVSYDADDPIPKTGVRPDVGKPGVSGVIDLTNKVRSELGLPLRQSGRHKGDLYRGPVRAFRNTCSIEFIDSKGKRVPLRWRI